MNTLAAWSVLILPALLMLGVSLLGLDQLWSHWARQSAFWRKRAAEFRGTHRDFASIAAQAALAGDRMCSPVALMSTQDQNSADDAVMFADECAERIPALVRGYYVRSSTARLVRTVGVLAVFCLAGCLPIGEALGSRLIYFRDVRTGECFAAHETDRRLFTWVPCTTRVEVMIAAEVTR